MTVPFGVPAHFPDDTGADTFVAQFPTVVAPADREYLSTKPPLFLLRVPGSGDEYERRVRRVVEALRQPLDDMGKLVPHAVLEAGAADTGLLAAVAGERLGYGIPRHMIPDRLPHFSLLRDVIAEVMAHGTGTGAAIGAKALRDKAYAQRVQRGGLPAVLWKLGGGENPPGDSFYGWLLGLLWVPLTQTFPRWWWALRKTRQLVRPMRLSPFRRERWLGAELNAERGKENLFRVLDDMARRQVVRLALDASHPQREESLQRLEDLLVRALLEDLRVPSPGRLLPRRRRRTARPVLVVEVPPEGTAGAVQAERMLRAFHRAHAAAQPPGPLVIAVGRPSDTLLAELGNPEESNFTQAGLQLTQKDGRPVLVTLREEPLTRHGLPILRVNPKTFNTSWQTTTSLVTAGAVASAAVLGVWAAGVIRGPQAHPCVGGDDSVAASAQAEPVSVRPKEWYDAAADAIRKENKRAEALAVDAGRTVRTVVAFESNRPTTEINTRFDGSIPELRGIALWQRQLNDEAISDDTRVPLRVEVRTTGKDFQDAEQEARKLVAEQGDGRPRKPYEQVIGVLGYSQSRDETRAALKVLGAAGIPTLGTTATADEMLDGDNQSYWPFAPANSTESRIEADFASRFDIVARRNGQAGCTTAEQAVIVQSPADLYSRSLTEKFSHDFPGRSQVINFAQNGDFRRAPAGTPRVTSAHDLAGTVCRALKAQPRSIVFWSARARDFIAFINALNTQGTCIEDDLTVLGGNELTMVAQTGSFSDKRWLRLYYSSHRIPVTDRRASDKTRQFVDAYDRFVRTTTQGADPWRQDGHAAVAYDAFHVLSRAADVTYRDKHADRRSMLTALSSGMTFDGATGYIAYQAGANTAPPDKTFVLLRQGAKGAVSVVACGAYRQGLATQEQGPPCAADGNR
ncbi:ABC transporter substrate-binding protein [Streptomyces sp. NPDC058773]|uniref:ABC transporter substrate-binding protein n=1 Tax=Streptomyces sp. NPDC058773 TaxID=3346632 RepID=UPI0036CCB0AC